MCWFRRSVIICLVIAGCSVVPSGAYVETMGVMEEPFYPEAYYLYSNHNSYFSCPGKSSHAISQEEMFINVLKKKESYETFETFVQRLNETVPFTMSSSAQTLRLQLLFDMTNATFRRDADPTAELMTTLGKKYSKLLMKNGAFELMDYRLMLDQNQIKMLQNIATLRFPYENGGVIRWEETMQFITKLKNIFVKQITWANTMRLFELPPPLLCSEKPEFNRCWTWENFRTSYIISEFISALKTEPAAVEIFKDIGLIARVLRDETSYRSIDTMLHALVESKRLEALKIIVERVGNCVLSPLKSGEKKILFEKLALALRIPKIIFVDDYPITKRRLHNAQEVFMAQDQCEVEEFFAKIGSFFRSLRERRFLTRCFLSSAEHALLKDLRNRDVSTFSEQELENIRKTSPVVYAITYLVNFHISATRSNQGLSEPANAFLQKIQTTPNALLWLSELIFPSTEIEAELVDRIQKITMQFEHLSVDAKKELVEAYPYRAIVSYAISMWANSSNE